MNDDDGTLLPNGEPELPYKPKLATAAKAEPALRRAASARDDAADEDLSAAIASTIARERGEQVTCRRITKNHYRCNWWRAENKAGYDSPLMGGLLVTMNRICKSQFLRVAREPGGGSLKMTVL